MSSPASKTKTVTDHTPLQDNNSSSTWLVPGDLTESTRWTPPPGVVIQGYPSEPSPVQNVPALTVSISLDGTPIVATHSTTSSGTVTLVGTDSFGHFPILFTNTQSN